MAAAALAAGADPSWFPYVSGGSMGGLPSLDHALQTVAACRSQQWAQVRSALDPMLILLAIAAGTSRLLPGVGDGPEAEPVLLSTTMQSCVL